MADPQLKRALEARLREKALSSLETYSYENAAFYADKLVSLQKTPGNVLLLAKAYFLWGDHARALSILQLSGYVPKTDVVDARVGVLLGDGVPRKSKDVVDCLLLAARCLEATKEWVKCMHVLSMFDPAIGKTDLDPTEPDALEVYAAVSKKLAVFEDFPDMASVVYSIAGRCCEESERRGAARLHYRLSLYWDSYCWESYYRSVDGHLSTYGGAEEAPLQLNFNDADPVDQVVEQLYSCKLSYLQLGPSSLVKAKQPVLFPNAKATLRLREEEALTSYFGTKNPYILHCRAERLYYAYHVHAAMEVAFQVLSLDPYHEASCSLYTATLVSMRRKTDLFQLGHEIANRAPHSVLSWFVVGCYYFAVGDYDKAGRYFYKATVANPSFLPAWIAYGHTFHALEEGEHTMAAYRSAMRLFPGCHLAALYMGMEQAKSGILPHAHSFLEIASSLVGGTADPLIANETGVAKYKVGQYQLAKDHFLSAIYGEAPAETASGHMALPCERNDPYWEPVVFNLGHCYRKLRQYDKALMWYSHSLEIRPHNSSVLSAIGFTYHLLGSLDDAIHYYHKALSLKSNDSFSRDMLDRAVTASFRKPIAPVFPPNLAGTVSQSPSGYPSATPPPGASLSASTLARRLIDEM
eukprot:TRINITY_DN17589_c0_g1_i1.p1 TRINITY_DN17589_c0_g1~~TRINITY_DN17589_c0_g1_i1.p1  ORF type:complete len:661 (+),score=209.12 TRINITY_DN17589_c0_g1_i1:71-1984(+)